MNDGMYAIYLGKVYSSGIDRNGNMILRSTNINDTQKGFSLCEPFKYKGLDDVVVCIKYVRRNEVEEYYKIKNKAIYKGHEFEIVEEDEKKLSIVTMRGDYREWEKIGMTTIDKGVYQRWIDRNEVTIKVEKKML